MKLSGNTILITGGGSGIGMALAHRLHDQGNVVIIAGRREVNLARAAQGRPNIHTLRLDIDSQRDIAAFVPRVIERHPALNVLVNNAGIMRIEQMDRSRDLADSEAIISTNLLGPIRLTNGLVDHLSAQSDAVILNVTSGLAFVPLIAAPTYSATKSALHAYSVAMREALKGRIEVIELIPPAVETEAAPDDAPRAGFQQLEDFADEVMRQLGQQPTPAEILVEGVRFARFAEAQGQFDTMLAMINGLNRPVEQPGLV